MNRTKNIMALALVGMTTLASAQVAEGTELYKILKSKDSLLFDAAFNRCDTDTMASLFTEDFEFYHDRGGFTDGREEFLRPTRENCEKRDPSAPQYAKRILIDGSLEVYPLKKDGELYGAIQHGIHRFEFLNDKNEYQKGDIAKFTHVWMLVNGEWKIKRELSYDHHNSSTDEHQTMVSLATEVLDQYEGNYKSPQVGEVSIKRESDHLLLQSKGFQATLYPQSEDTFFIKERGTKFKFIMTDKKVSKMVILENDQIVDEAQKT